VEPAGYEEENRRDNATARYAQHSNKCRQRRRVRRNAAEVCHRTRMTRQGSEKISTHPGEAGSRQTGRQAGTVVQRNIEREEEDRSRDIGSRKEAGMAETGEQTQHYRRRQWQVYGSHSSNSQSTYTGMCNSCRVLYMQLQSKSRQRM